MPASLQPGSRRCDEDVRRERLALASEQELEWHLDTPREPEDLHRAKKLCRPTERAHSRVRHLWEQFVTSLIDQKDSDDGFGGLRIRPGMLAPSVGA